MIGKLRGIIDSIAEDYLILDVNGVGYLIYGSSRMLQQLQMVQGEVSLIIETHVREDHIHLFGFMSETERDWYRLLTTVQGVGAKMALAIMATMDVEELHMAIAAQDIATLTRANGVGKKLAERIVNELKNKLGKIAGSATPMPALSGKSSPAKATSSGTGSIHEDAVSALVNLGYGRSDAYAVVARTMQSGVEDLDGIIKESLKELVAV